MKKARGGLGDPAASLGDLRRPALVIAIAIIIINNISININIITLRRRSP